MKKKLLCVLTCAVIASAFILPACETTDSTQEPPVDPNDKIELKRFSMLDEEASANNSYPLGIEAPTDWTQVYYDLSFTDGFDIYGYCLQTGKSPFSEFSYDIYTPILRLKGTDGEYAYGYADFGSSSLPASAQLNYYLSLFLEANDYETPEKVNEITMTSWTPSGEKLKGLSFDKQISDSTTERIVIFKTGSSGGPIGKDCSVFGVFRIGCDTEDFSGKKTLFDRMEKTIFGWGIDNIERYEDDYFKNVRKESCSALGLTLHLPTEYGAFTLGDFGYANVYGNLYFVWSNNEGYLLENAGTVKVEIWRDPISFSDVFAPVTNLYDLHSEDVYGLSVAPPRLTTLPDGTVAVYSVHNSYEGVKEVVKEINSGNLRYSLHIKEATRKIVYTLIHGDYIYNVDFTFVYNYVLEENGSSISTAINTLNTYEEYLAFKTMDSITFD